MEVETPLHPRAASFLRYGRNYPNVWSAPAGCGSVNVVAYGGGGGGGSSGRAVSGGGGGEYASFVTVTYQYRCNCNTCRAHRRAADGR